MSKVFESQAQKTLDLVEGLRRNMSEAQKMGITPAELDLLEKDARSAVVKIQEVDAIREEVSSKLKVANGELASVKDRTQELKKRVKGRYAPEQWTRFGISDKR